MVLQILVREPRYQRSASGGFISSPNQQQPLSSLTGGNSGSSNVGGGVNPRRSAAVPLTNPGGLPMAVIGTPTSGTPTALEAPERYTQIVAVWQADCLVCGLSPFDSDTLVLLGYPVEEDDYEEEGEEGLGEGEGASVWAGGRGVFQPEVQLVKRRNGEVGCGLALGWEPG